MTQQQIAETVGKDRTTVANMLRVLQLPDSVRKLLEEGQLSLGHAKVLLAVDDPAQITRLAREIVSEGLTVRELEHLLGCVSFADDELHDYFTQLMDAAGAMLWGRVTYELMESAWPAVARDENAPRARP